MGVGKTLNITMFVETDDADYETLALPSVRPKGFASPSASRAVAIVSPTVNDDVGGGGERDGRTKRYQEE